MATAIFLPDQVENPFVEALISGLSYTPGDTILYYFDPSGGVSTSFGVPANWTHHDGADAFILATEAWSNVANIKFMITRDERNADWIETTYSDFSSGELGAHYLPNNEQLGGQFNRGHELYTTANNQPGGISFLTFLHEIGHGLGLDHPFGEDPFPGVTIGDAEDTGDNGLNQGLYTVMGYNDETDVVGTTLYYSAGYPATPMAFDIAAVQELYGANMKTAKGDDSYALPSFNPSAFLQCIWDAGGVDEISGGGFSDKGGCTIDLRAATLRNEPGGGGFLSRQDGVIGGYTIAHGVVIENAEGSSYADRIIGNRIGNVIDGGGGEDTMTGGAGADIFEYHSASDSSAGEEDLITDFESGVDSFDLIYLGVSASSITRDGDERILSLTADDGALRIRVRGDLDEDDLILAEALSLAGGSGADRLTGGDGRDRANAGAGDDTVEGAAGVDALAGEDGADVLLGGRGGDRLDGGRGVDRLEGGAGDDVFVVDSPDDVVVERANGGSDEVASSADYILSAHVEALTLIGRARVAGTGNGLANQIDGNAAANALRGEGGDDRLAGHAGDDVLDGGGGADVLQGGAGSDRYVVDHVRDEVVERSKAGDDRVDASISYVLGADVERLRLTGDARIDGEGNAADNFVEGNAAANRLRGRDGVDRLDGRDGADTLEGGRGADSMTGGRGNDLFLVDRHTDVVVEARDGGLDRVESTSDYTLGDHLEELALIGDRDTDATGNAAANLIFGSAGDNRLFGLGGDDRLEAGAGDDDLRGGGGRDVTAGGEGADRFSWDDGEFGGSSPATMDRILDFTRGDRIDLGRVDARVRGDDDAFSFIATAAFSGRSGQLRYETDGRATYLSGDLDGDRAADFTIRLDGRHELTTADLIL